MNINLLNFPVGLAIGLGIFIVLVAVVLAILPVKYWFRCLVSGTYLSMMKIFGMKLRGIDLNVIIDSYINARKAGLDLNINDLENHMLAGGNVNKIVMALISAHSAKIKLTTQEAKAIDLAGRDVLQAVKESVTPKVIQTPKISAIAQDGIELIITAKVTVKTNLQRLVGGAGEETIISRVGEGIVTTVGSTTSNAVLENPDEISFTVISKGLGDGTAYDIISIDIADIDVGKNAGAELKIKAALAEKEVAQAKAEERKSMALALEQEKKAALVEAEAAVPKAIAEAFKDGKLGVYDYYKLQNIVADTDMRKSFSNDDKKD